MSEFKVGDRVAFYASVGTVTVVGTPRIEVQADDGTQHWFGAISQAHLRRIGEPWQGECAGCHKSIDATTAHLLTPWLVHAPEYVCWHCWENQRGWYVPFKPSHVSQEQREGLATSRAWMRQRYPDEAKWTEATT